MDVVDEADKQVVAMQCHSPCCPTASKEKDPNLASN